MRRRRQALARTCRLRAKGVSSLTWDAFGHFEVDVFEPGLIFRSASRSRSPEQWLSILRFQKNLGYDSE